MIKQGTIYVVATPIGNLDDMTIRAVRVLSSVNFIAAEDTRHSQKLLAHFNLRVPLIALHDFNEKQRVDAILQKVMAGESLALITDAGTPLISDPGYTLIHQAHLQGITVSPLPGACALIAALCVSGLPTDRFIFEGFLPVKAQARQDRLQELCPETRTLIFYEAPHRLLALVADLNHVFGGDRRVTLAKELTKTFETIYATDLANLHVWLQADPLRQKGEFVLIVKGFSETKKNLLLDENKVLATLKAELPLKQAVALTAKLTGQPKNALYKKALDRVDS